VKHSVQSCAQCARKDCYTCNRVHSVHVKTATQIVSLNSVFMFASIILYIDTRETFNCCQFVREITLFVFCMETYFRRMDIVYTTVVHTAWYTFLLNSGNCARRKYSECTYPNSIGVLSPFQCVFACAVLPDYWPPRTRYRLFWPGFTRNQKMRFRILLPPNNLT
jgi:hypothetical protein